MERIYRKTTNLVGYSISGRLQYVIRFADLSRFGLDEITGFQDLREIPHLDLARSLPLELIKQYSLEIGYIKDYVRTIRIDRETNFMTL